MFSDFWVYIIQLLEKSLGIDQKYLLIDKYHILYIKLSCPQIVKKF